MTLAYGPLSAVYLAFLLVHVVAGFIGIYGGLVPLFTRKGGKAHRRWGLIFTWAMGIAAITAFPLAWLRADPFQAAVGVFSGYLTLFGFRVLRRHQQGDLPLLDWGLALLALAAFGATAGTGAYLLREQPGPAARAALVFGGVGLLVVARDIQGLVTKNTTFARRIQDHLIASSLALVSGFSAFLNTQFYRLTHVDWPLDQKMLLPFLVALPLLAYWVPTWNKRLRNWHTTSDILRASGEETSEVERLRAFGMAEAISFLLLIGVAVPLKRLAGHPEFVRVMGSVHGALFVVYVVSAILAARSLRWPLKTLVLALGAAVVPFGPFIFEAVQRRKASL